MDSYQRKVELVGQLKQIAKSMESDLRASKRQNILDTVPKDTAKKMCAAFLKKNMSPAKLSDIVLPKPRNNKTKKSVSPKKNTRSNEINSYNSNYNSNLPLVDIIRGIKRKTNKNVTRKSTKRTQLMSKRNIAKRMEKPCPPGMVRSEKTGYCRKEEYAKKSYDKKPPCKDGKVRHPKTGYCRKPNNMNVSYKKKHSQQKTRNVRKNVTKKVRISNENAKIYVEDVGRRGETPNNYSPMKKQPEVINALSNVSNENLDRMLKKDDSKMLKYRGEEPNNYNPMKEQPKIIGSPSNVSNNEWNEMIPAKYKDLVN